MKKMKRIVATLTLACAFLFGTGSVVHVRADTSGPQGQTDSKSKGPSTGSSSQADLALLWLIILWLLGLL
jgi:hypothetical protein